MARVNPSLLSIYLGLQVCKKTLEFFLGDEV